jgi:hypothetical protein
MSSDYAAVGRGEDSLNASGSALFSSFLAGHQTKRLTFAEDHKTALTPREQHWLSSYFTLLARNRQDAQLLSRERISAKKPDGKTY